ncbi:MAG TPA: YfhO family protein [Rhodothermales bacterium]|nr:YfhO family protein [Rhodothermales bacterium]
MAQASKQRARRTNRSAGRSTDRAGRIAAATDLWHRMSSRMQHVVCLLFLLAVSLAFFAPIHFGGYSIMAGDIVSWRAMAETTIQYQQATGHKALWAPNAFGGMPTYTITSSPSVPQIDTVLAWLRAFLWPTSHFFVLLVGMYVLIVFLTGKKLSAVLAACAFGLTTYIPIILIAGHNTKFISLCFAPWLVLAFAFALRRPGLLSGLLFAAALAVNLRAGHVQITYYVAMLLAIWWIVELVGALRHARLKPFASATGWLALGAVLGVLMVAQPYLLLREYKMYSQRGGGGETGAAGLGWDYAMNWSQGVGELVTLAVADAYGGAANYWGGKPFTAGPHYVGGIVLLLAALALWRVRRNAVWGLGIAALFMILFALGSNFPLLNRPMYEHFPLFSAFRAPETWLSAVALTLAALAGIGLAYLARREDTPEADLYKTNAALIASAVGIGLVLLLVVFQTTLFSFERPGEMQQAEQFVAQRLNLPADSPQVVATARQLFEEQVKQPRIEMFRKDALRTLIFLILAGALIFAYNRRIFPGWVLQVAMALLVLVDLWGVDRRYFNKDVLKSGGVLEAQIPTYDFDQVILEKQKEAGGMGHFRVLSLESRNPLTNARPSYFYESLGGYNAAKLSLYQNFADEVLFDPQTGIPNQRALDLLNTRYVIAPGVLPGMNVVFRNPQGYVVLENPDALPRAFFVGQTEVVSSPEETLNRIESGSFDLARTALLPAPIDFETTPLDSTGSTSVELQQYTPDEITWRAQTDAPRLMVASEIYYPAGWKAFVDGNPVPIYRADYLLRAVPVPAGEHTVVMRFEPRSVTTSFWLSLLSTIAVYGGIVVLVGITVVRKNRGAAVSEARSESASAS